MSLKLKFALHVHVFKKGIDVFAVALSLSIQPERKGKK